MINLHESCVVELMIRMKCQVLFSLKNNKINFNTVILPPLLIQMGQLSVTGKSMCTKLGPWSLVDKKADS